MKYEFEKWCSNGNQSMETLQKMWRDFNITEFRKNFTPEEEPILTSENLEISESFLEMLILSYEVAILHKRNALTEATSDTVITLGNKLDKMYQDTTDSLDIKFNDIVALAASFFNMATVYKDCATKRKVVVVLDYLWKTMELLRDCELEPKAILIVMRTSVLLHSILNKLGKYKCTLSDELYPHIDAAVTAYLEYTQNKNMPPPIAVCLISLDMEDDEELNSKVSLLMLYSELVSQMHRTYAISRAYRNSFIKAMHNIVKMGATSPSFEDKIPWACGLVMLARYFGDHYRFTEMRDHLAAAQSVMDVYLVDCMNRDAMESDESRGITCDKVYGSIAQSWGIYASLLLLSSTYKLRYYKQRNNDTDNDSRENVMYVRKCPIDKPLLFTNEFQNLDFITNAVTDAQITNIVHARILLDFASNWFDKAKQYFCNAKLPKNLISLEITKDISIILKCLVYYETDRAEQIRIHKHRINILETACKPVCHTKEEKNALALIHLRLMMACSNLIDSLTEEMEINDSASTIMPQIRHLVSSIFRSKELFKTLSSFKPNDTEPKKESIQTDRCDSNSSDSGSSPSITEDN